MQRSNKLKSLIGVLFLLLSISIIGVSAFVYEAAQQSVTQNIKEIATLTLQNAALGDIEEGETIYYTPNNLSSLDDIVSITTAKDNVFLHFDSDLDTNSSLQAYYATYTISIIFDQVGRGSSQSGIACTLQLGSADPSAILLDKAGTWTFDFEIITTAKSVSSDTGTAVAITVTAESTS